MVINYPLMIENIIKNIYDALFLSECPGSITLRSITRYVLYGYITLIVIFIEK
ncbi:hypothetical protein LEWO105114_13030 [Legionella worsleiensis]|uniref:Uncharacterized protein n=1 Tax=Legionella worsleiensis TaxID=45076 RepID=A0A0W1A3Q1_9GAMM|nr:hypothetical protein Lwor_2390 [Legionella worsleiensis]STY32836.1 Uncharacterised protein [Legionella worsleiensis]